MKSVGAPHNLPPIWVRVCSWWSLVFLLIPILASLLDPKDGWVNMLGMSVDTVGPSEHWAMALQVLLFASGLTGLAILVRWKWAYDFGMAYASMSIFVGILGLLANVGGVRDDLPSTAIQHLAFIAFLVHLARHRREWRSRPSNSPLHPPSGAHAAGEGDRLQRTARGCLRRRDDHASWAEGDEGHKGPR